MVHLEASFAGIAILLWLTLILLLHFIKPQRNPARSMCSEYARGKHGWIMQLAFYSMAAGCLALVFAAWPYLPHFGLILLFLIGLAFGGAGVFVTDPVLTPQEHMTRSGQFHNLFAMIAIFLFPVMVTMISIAMHNTWISLLAVLTWLGCVGFVWAMVRTGRRGQQVPFGYYQRFMIFASSVWLVVVAFTLS